MCFFLVLALAFFDILLYNYTIVSGIVDGVVIGLKENGGITTSLRTLNQ